MATVWNQRDESNELASATPPRSQYAHDVEIRSLKWTVRLLFAAFAVLRVVAACGVEISALAELTFVLAGLTILAHVAATVVATSRRDASQGDSAETAPRGREITIADRARLPGPSLLHGELPLGVWIISCATAGAVGGALVMAALTFPAWPRIGIVGVAILLLSAATIGAYFGLMTGRLTATARKALGEATAQLRRDQQS